MTRGILNNLKRFLIQFTFNNLKLLFLIKFRSLELFLKKEFPVKKE